MLIPVRTVAPATLPVTLDEAKAECRILHSDDDPMILGYIEAVVSHIDGYFGTLGRALITQTWQMDASCFDSRLYLPVGDLIAVTGITYYDSANASAEVDDATYTALSDRLGPYVTPLSGQYWPSAYWRPDAVRVTWTAGYGAAGTDVPTAIRQAILLAVRDWYDGTVGPGGLSDTSLALLAPFRRISI